MLAEQVLDVHGLARRWELWVGELMAVYINEGIQRSWFVLPRGKDSILKSLARTDDHTAQDNADGT